MTQLGALDTDTVEGLDADAVEVLPGQTATCGFVVRNTSDAVEEYTFQVGDEISGWTAVEPDRARVHPGTEQRVTLTFRPPRTGGPASGEQRYRLYVTPTEHPESPVVLESALRILPFIDLAAEIAPHTATGGLRAGRHRVLVHNQGNAPVDLRVSGIAPRGDLVIDPKPATLTVGPGRAAFLRVRVRPSRIRLRGQPVVHPYQLSITSEDAAPLSLDAVLIQRPLLPPGAVRAVAGLAALVMVVAALWFGVARPAVTAVARDAARDEVEPVARRAQQAETAAQAAAEAVQEAPRQSSPRRGTADTPGGIPAGADLFSQRLATVSRLGAAGRDEYRVPDGSVLILTFVNLQNPWGGRGSLDLIAGERTLFTEEQAYYRNEIRYLPTPVEVPSGQSVRLRTRCAATGTPPAGTTGAPRCRSYALLGGYLMTP